MKQLPQRRYGATATAPPAATFGRFAVCLGWLAAHLRPPAAARLLAPALAGLALVVRPAPLVAQELDLQFRGKRTLPATAIDQYGIEFDVSGLSGITWVGGPRYLAVMDNSDKVIALDLRVECNGHLRSAAITGGLTLEDHLDGEGIAAAGPDTLWIADEASLTLRAYDRHSGARLATLDLPAVYTTPGNVVPGYGLESLSRRPAATPAGPLAALFTANEEALTVDGPLSTPASGTIVRIQQLRADTTSGSPLAYLPVRQVAYETNPIHGTLIENARSGLSDLVALPDGRLLTLERSFAFSIFGFWRNRIFEIDPAIGTDISQPPYADSLLGQTYEITPKRKLWASYADVGNNLEGIGLGSRLPGGNHLIIGVVDNDQPLSPNEIAAFELSGEFGGSDETDLILLSAPDSAAVGSLVTLHLANAPADSPFYIYEAAAADGSLFDDHPFDLVPPVKLLGSGLTDPLGSATWRSAPIPANAAGSTIHLEAVAPFGCLYAESNPATLVIY
jgi:hypothetical protein